MESMSNRFRGALTVADRSREAVKPEQRRTDAVARYVEGHLMCSTRSWHEQPR